MSSLNTGLQSREKVIAHSQIIHGHGSKRLTRSGYRQLTLVLLSLHRLCDFFLELRELPLLQLRVHNPNHSCKQNVSSRPEGTGVYPKSSTEYQKPFNAVSKLLAMWYRFHIPCFLIPGQCIYSLANANVHAFICYIPRNS